MDIGISLEKPTKKLFREIQSVDAVAFGIDPVPLAWYIENYGKLEWIATARKESGEMIGCRIVAGLVDPIYDAIKTGLLSGDYSISHRSYLKLRETNKYYLVSTAVHPEYRKNGLSKALNDAALKKLQEYHPSFDLLSIAVSDGGVKIAERLGLKRIDMINSRRIMYGRIS